MGENVEFVVANRLDHARADDVRINSRQHHLGADLAVTAQAMIDLSLPAIFVLAIAAALENARAHESRTENRDADVEGRELTVPTLAHRHDGVLRRRVRLHAWRADD